MYNKKKRNHPHYNFENFKKACKNKDLIYIPHDVLADADNYFRLRSKKQILDFIKNNGLENLHFLYSNEWKNNPNKNVIIMIDNYEFKSWGKLGFIAFRYNNKNNKWIIKSFHLSKNMNDAMRIAINKADLINKLGGKI
jgi:hypothetical protein